MFRHCCFRYIHIVLFLFSSFFPITCFSWGFQGHRIVALLSERLWTPEASDFFHSVYPNLTSADVAVLPDQNRLIYSKKMPKSNGWHYFNIGVCSSSSIADIKKKCQEVGLACGLPKLQSFLDNVTVLQGEEQQIALAYILHLLGDYHQPLHIGENSDRGGNDQMVMMPNSRRVKKFHSIWDVDLVLAAMKGLSIDAYVAHLFDKHKDRFAQFQSGSIEDWILETYKISKEFSYAKLSGFACSLPPQTFVTSTPKLSVEYVEKAAQIVEEQLVRAAARLAMVFNNAVATGEHHKMPTMISSAPMIKKDKRVVKLSPAKPITKPQVDAQTKSMSEEDKEMLQRIPSALFEKVDRSTRTLSVG